MKGPTCNGAARQGQEQSNYCGQAKWSGQGRAEESGQETQGTHQEEAMGEADLHAAEHRSHSSAVGRQVGEDGSHGG